MTATRGGLRATGGLCSKEELPQVREQELREAARILSFDALEIASPTRDKELAAAPPDEIRRSLVGAIRRERPAIVVTFDPNGFNLHTDHIAISRFTTDAIGAASDPRWFQSLELRHVVQRLLWIPPVMPWDSGEFPPRAGVDFLVDTGTLVQQRARALAAHKTQIVGIEERYLKRPDVERLLSFRRAATRLGTQLDRRPETGCSSRASRQEFRLSVAMCLGSKLTIDTPAHGSAAGRSAEERANDSGETDRAVAVPSPGARIWSCTGRVERTPAVRDQRPGRSSRRGHCSIARIVAAGLNDEPPADINILHLENVPRRFHAPPRRRRAPLSVSGVPAPHGLCQGLCVVGEGPDQCGRMREAAKAFVGMRDFQSFSAREVDVSDSESPPTRFDARFDRPARYRRGGQPDSDRHRRLALPVENGATDGRSARRNRTGTIDQGSGHRFLAEASEGPARLTAPPSGLFLDRVYYGNQPRDPSLRPVTPLT